MPTKKEWEALSSQCAWTWTDDVHDEGSYGDYWSSSLSTGTPSEAYLVWFGRKDVSWVYYYRYVGYSVRPVWEE